MSPELKEIIKFDDPPPPYEPIREKKFQWKKLVFLIAVILIFVLLIGVAIGVYQLFISRCAPVPVAPEPSSSLEFTKEKLRMTGIRAPATNATSSSTMITTTPNTTITTQATVTTTKLVRKETTPNSITTTPSTSKSTMAPTKIKTPSLIITTSDEYEYEDEDLESDAYEEDRYELPTIEIGQPTTTKTTTGEPLIPWHLWDARDQEVTVEGVLLCDGYPARGIKIKMYEKDTFSADDKLAEVSTDGNGRFRVTGNSRELPGVRMKVHINFYHRCQQLSWELCDYKSTLRVPNDFITSKGERPKVFQVGHLDLAEITHTRDCFN